MSGKGSGRRPMVVSEAAFAEAWERAYGKRVARMPEDRVETDSESRYSFPAGATFVYGWEVTFSAEDGAIKKITTPVLTEVMPLDFGNEDES